MTHISVSICIMINHGQIMVKDNGIFPSLVFNFLVNSGKLQIKSIDLMIRTRFLNHRFFTIRYKTSDKQRYFITRRGIFSPKQIQIDVSITLIPCCSSRACSALTHRSSNHLSFFFFFFKHFNFLVLFLPHSTIPLSTRRLYTLLHDFLLFCLFPQPSFFPHVASFIRGRALL